jgi:hypothetical protein
VGAAPAHRPPRHQDRIRQELTVPDAVNAALFAMVTLGHTLAPLLDKLRLPGASLWFARKRAADPANVLSPIVKAG